MYGDYEEYQRVKLVLQRVKKKSRIRDKFDSLLQETQTLKVNTQNFDVEYCRSCSQ